QNDTAVGPRNSEGEEEQPRQPFSDKRQWNLSAHPLQFCVNGDLAIEEQQCQINEARLKKLQHRENVLLSAFALDLAKERRRRFVSRPKIRTEQLVTRADKYARNRASVLLSN